MSPLSSSSSSQSEPWKQAVIGLVGPSFSTGITLSFTLYNLTLPWRYPLKGVRKKLSELSLISVISMSLGFQMFFQCSACFTCNLSGRQPMELTCGASSDPTKLSVRAWQLMNLRASLALKVREMPAMRSVMMQSFLLKMMVGGRKSLHCSASCSISSDGANPDSWKVKCQFSSEASCVFIQKYLKWPLFPTSPQDSPQLGREAFVGAHVQMGGLLWTDIIDRWRRCRVWTSWGT